MAFCTNCGSSVPDGTKFCPNCGAQVGAANNNANSANPGAGQQNFNGANGPQGGPQFAGQPYGGQPNGQPRGISFGQRNIAVAIILSIVTCGIYGIYWIIKLVDETNEAAGEPNATSGGMVFLLSLVTCDIYLLVWLYKAGERLNNAKRSRGLPADSNSGVIYLVLAIFGFGIVSYALIQNELNKIAAYHGAPAA